ncbi:MAG: helix-turn-helix domain-containing protein [Planctomycetota bacterium]
MQPKQPTRTAIRPIAVQQIVSGARYSDVSRQHDIPRRTLRRWVQEDANPPPPRGHCAPLEPEKRKRVVDAILRGEDPITIAKREGVHKSTVYRARSSVSYGGRTNPHRCPTCGANITTQQCLTCDAGKIKPTKWF